MTVNFHQAFHFLRHFFTAARKGHGVHSPFAYQLCEEVFYNTAPFYVFNYLDAIRRQLLQSGLELRIEDYGAGSKKLKSDARKVGEIAAAGISTKKQSETLFRLINFMGCKKCVELGTSLGLNSLYMASVNSSIRIITIEGSPSLGLFAQQLARQNAKNNIEFITARFDDALEEALDRPQPTDLVYFDGHHTYEATLRYFKTALKYRHANTVFVFDDIYWSKGMTRAWKEISAHPEVRMSIDTFFTGYVFFREEIREKVALKFYT